MSNLNLAEINKIKAILIGNANVGKSNIFSRIVSNRFEANGTPTLGAAFHMLYLTINSQKLSIELWDTAGQERYYSIAQSYSRDASIIILVYDITDRSSFEELQKWYERLNFGPNSGKIFGVFANKEDLVEDEAVALEEGVRFAQSISAMFRKTSAKENVGIREGFEELSELYLNSRQEGTRRFSSFKVGVGGGSGKKSCCR